MTRMIFATLSFIVAIFFLCLGAIAIFNAIMLETPVLFAGGLFFVFFGMMSCALGFALVDRDYPQ